MNGDDDLPLRGIRVVDLAVGHAAALTAKFLADCGAEVWRFEPATGDPFYAIYPAYVAWRAALTRIETGAADALVVRLAAADIVLLGGEVLAGFEPIGLPAIADHPRLIRIDIRPCIVDEGLPPQPSSDLIIQAATGMVFEARADVPAMLGYSVSGVGGCLQALVAIGAALYTREAHGQVVAAEVGLAESALTTFSTLWSWADDEPPWFSYNVPRAAAPIVAPCKDGRFVHVVLGAAGSKYRLYRLLGIDADLNPSDAGLPSPTDPDDRYFGDLPLIAGRIAGWDSDDLLAALAAEKIVAGPVLGIEEARALPQIVHNATLRDYGNGIVQPGCPIRFDASPVVAPAARHSETGLPLGDVMVLNFGAFVAGPTASVNLTDLGARVVKVENEGGDPLRGLAKFFAAANRGQRSVALDIKSAAGRALAGTLIETADVVCSNFKTGVAERLGIDAATLIAADPRKIVLFNSGFGATGPMADLPAFDPMMQALCGLERRAGGSGNPPALTRTMPVDTVGGLLGQIGVLFALVFRARTGRGMAIEVPLLHAPWLLTADVVSNARGRSLGPAELMTDRRGYAANEHLYRTTNGWVAVAARSAREKAALADLFGLHADDAWDEQAVAAIEGQTSRTASAALLERLAAAGVPAASADDTRGRPIIDNDRRRGMGLMYRGDRPRLTNVRGFARGFVLTGVDLPATGHVPVLAEANDLFVPPD